MAEQQQVTVREVAEIVLSNPHAEAAMHQELTNAGIKVGEDWAGRAAISQADARKYVGKIVRLRRQQEEEYLRGRELEMRIGGAQQDRDRLAEREYMNALTNLGKNKRDAVKHARALVLASEADLPKEVTRRLTWPALTHLMPYRPEE